MTDVKNPAERLTAIIADRESSRARQIESEAFLAQSKHDAAEKRKKTINHEANMKMEMDLYLQKNYPLGERVRMYMSINQFEDAVRDLYGLTAFEINSFQEYLEDLIDANISGLGIMSRDFEIENQNTARIILRVIYNDDWQKFLDDFAPRVGFVKKS